jgi:hypothetical protein
MNYSIGIWAHAEVPRGVVYRWEADGGDSGTGFVLLDTAGSTVRPSNGEGQTVGSLVMDASTGDVTGEAPGINRTTFVKTAAAVLKRYLAAGKAPETAHTYYG